MFSLAAFLIQWMMGKYALLEHPAPPDPERFPLAPGIWNLSVLELFQSLPGIRRNHIYQGHHGSRSPKPTCLLLAHGPELSQFAHPFRTRDDLPPPLKMGRAADRPGQYNTAVLKNYPPGLNAMLAGSFHWWVSHASSAPLQVPPDVLDVMTKLCVSECSEHFGPNLVY